MQTISKLSELEQIDYFIQSLKALKYSIKKKDKLSQKSLEADRFNSTPKRLQKIDADLTWECMNIDKEKTSFARQFQGSCLDVGTEEKEYHPSGFHTYKG